MPFILIKSILYLERSRLNITPLSKSAPFQVGVSAPIRPVIREPSTEVSACGSRFPAAFRPPAFASWTILSRWGVEPSSRSAYRTHARTPSGFPRSTRLRCDRVGCPLYPGTTVLHDHVYVPWPPSAASQRASPERHWCNPSAALELSRHQQGFTCVHPADLPLRL